MTATNKQTASAIIKFLETVVEKKEVSEDYLDSLNVAIDCIAESFEIERDEVANVLKEAGLQSSLPEYLSQGGNEEACKTEDVKVNIPVEDAALKEKAEALKLEGNKAVASKNYALAITKYTEAIEVLPTNAIYYANRAAAHSSLKQYDEAIADAEKAIEIDPNYSKGYSRLGFAKYAQNKPEEALEAYKKVMDLEGDKATDIMKRDYETAKKKVEQSLNLEKSAGGKDSGAGAGAGAGAGGFDFASMLGGGLSGLMNNPQIMQAAQQMMSNPDALQQMQSMMQDPSIRQMAENFTSGGGTPNMDDLMNNPAIRNMAGSMFGGAGAGAPGAPGATDAEPKGEIDEK
ncbi:Small glutamine-rich tetratricopeptide repeat-containing protein 2 [Nakaseomyces bracarensis]|uniref:Small glutamine-rich tetratricopeptide repeat-containing protein 2 n=1 Tax=Nakaseomyces bracarensis TaxID=273131 RepID=A0ABR4NT81_9SACH